MCDSVINIGAYALQNDVTDKTSLKYIQSIDSISLESILEKNQRNHIHYFITASIIVNPIIWSISSLLLKKVKSPAWIPQCLLFPS